MAFINDFALNNSVSEYVEAKVKSNNVRSQRFPVLIT